MPRGVTFTQVRSLICVLGWLGGATIISAAPLDLSQTPLFLSFRVESNVVLLFDDSSSMNWEVISGDFNNDGRYTGTQIDGSSPAGSGQVKHRDNDDNGTPDCDFGVGQSYYGYLYGVESPANTDLSLFRNCNTADDEEWRFRNYNFNPIYFNPNQTYIPWRGVDASGRPFQSMSVRAAKDNPYDPASRTFDLTRHNSRGDSTTSDRNGDLQPDGFRYYTWTDVNGNGLFDDGEETVHFIKDASPEVQENFANWFSYYRKREYVAKAVYGDIIANASNLRIGLVTLNNSRNGINPSVTTINTPLRSIDVDASNPGRPNADPTRGNRRILLDALYSSQGRGSTPLRAALWRVGEYLAGAPTRALFPTDNAYLSEAEGGACQQSFVILMTDGVDNTSRRALPPVGNADNDGVPASPRFDGGPYGDTYSQTLADVAMHFYERDLRPGLADRVPTTPTDSARHQHMVTYTVTFSGLGGTLSRDPLPTEDGTRFWPNPNPTPPNDRHKIDDLRHAAFNGRGIFLQSNDAPSLAEALRRALTNIAQRLSSVASVALNTGSLTTTSRLYQARFDSGTWSGQLLSIKLDPVTGNPDPQDTIDSGALLDQLLRDNHYNTRVRTILTYKPSTASGIPFQWPLLDAAQQAALHAVDGLGPDRLEFLRGSNAGEAPPPPAGRGRGFRVRAHRLGDLINSDPYFVGPPALPDRIDPSGTYRTFREQHAQRIPMLVVGGNDGMLHIFNASVPVSAQTPLGDPHAGREILAYVPNVILPNTVELTSPSYRHRYYVDGSPTAGDVVLARKGWRTVVVGGLRAGGQGYFALDITDPTQFSEDLAAAREIVLWEFTDADDPDLGFTYSQPALVRMANGQWAAVFGNGYNNSVEDGRASRTGHAVFFIVFLDGPGAGGRWVEGLHYIKVDTGVGDRGTPNGLATPAVVDLDGDFTADYIVAGDLRGNLWQLNVTSASPSDWKRPESLVRLFQATDATGTTQPITSRPEVGKHPANLGGFVVYFGTGKYLEPSDNAPTGPTQTFYGIWARNDPNVSPLVQRNELLRQTVIATSTITGADGQPRRARVTSDNRIEWQTHRGFYLDLPEPGERQVSDPVLRNGRVVFTTLIPTAQPCEFGGKGFVMVLDVEGGTRPESPFFDLNRDKKFDHNDTVAVAGGTGGGTTLPPSGLEGGITGTPTIQAAGRVDVLFESDGGAGLRQTDVDPGPGAVGRQAWRQITQ